MPHTFAAKEAGRIDGPDDHAVDDYFAHQMNMYQGGDHPQAGYRCDGGDPEEELTWRFSAPAAANIQAEVMDENGNFVVSFIGV